MRGVFLLLKYENKTLKSWRKGNFIRIFEL
jgi:hypothetical protein